MQVALGAGVWVAEAVGLTVGEHVIVGVGICALVGGINSQRENYE